MEDLQKIKEFFSKPLKEERDIYDEIANEEFGMDYDQLGPNEKEWVRDEVSNMNESKKETGVDMAKKRLDQLGVKYEMSKTDKVRPFKVIYKPINKSDKFYDEFEDIVDLFNLKGFVKTSMNESKEESLYKNWDQFEKPSKIKVYLNNGKTLEITPLKLKGGKRVYDAILQAFIDDRFDITNKVIQGMTNNLSEAKEEDAVDTITMDIPLFLRMLEYSREDAKKDLDLHDVTEKANKLGKERGILSMEDYEEIVGAAEEIKELKGKYMPQDKLEALDMWISDMLKYKKPEEVKQIILSKLKANLKDNTEELTEAYVPSNIKEFAKRKGVSSLVNKVAGWAERVGQGIRGGTAIGYNYSTLVLDMTYQGSEIRINTDNDTVTLYDEPVRSFGEFQRVFADGADNNLEEGEEEQLSFISKARAKSSLRQFLSGKRDDGMGKFDAIVYGIDTDGKKHQIKYYNDLQNYEKFALGNNPDIKENVAPNHDGKSGKYGSGYEPLEERIAKALDRINEDLCPAGKAYIKRRQAAGEKSSAYLSGRGVKVCKGQMSGRKKKK
jgi:hypothetical protein